jgi:TRAP-type mannitol/chloroaromatic compound transport system substrate-binding protein
MGGDRPFISWRMATSWPTYLGVRYSALDFCQTVSLLTGGRFAITPYPSGALVPPLKVFDGVTDGTVDCGHTTLFYYTDKSIAFNFGTGIPFGLTAEQHNAWLYGAGGIDALNQMMSRFGAIAFPAGNSGTQMGGWYRRKITRTADLRGLKIRITGLGAEILSRLGAEIIATAAEGIVPALLEGAIDAVEWIGPHDDTALGLVEAAPYYYYPGWWEPGTSFAVVVNLKTWQELPPVYQAAVESAAAAVNLRLTARYNVLNSRALVRLQQQGATLLPFPEEVLNAAAQTATKLYGELAQKDRDFAQIYRPWSEFRDRIHAWQRVSYLSFTDFSYQYATL